MKASGDLSKMIGWHTRNLHYVKKLPEMADYLKPPAKPDDLREQGARAVKRMFDRMIAKQEKEQT